MAKKMPAAGTACHNPTTLGTPAAFDAGTITSGLNPVRSHGQTVLKSSGDLEQDLPFATPDFENVRPDRHLNVRPPEKS